MIPVVLSVPAAFYHSLGISAVGRQVGLQHGVMLISSLFSARNRLESARQLKKDPGPNSDTTQNPRTMTESLFRLSVHVNAKTNTITPEVGTSYLLGPSVPQLLT